MSYNSSPSTLSAKQLCALSTDAALNAFRENVNCLNTIFSTDHWLEPKLMELRRLLPDQLTEEQAGAMLDVLYRNAVGERGYAAYMADLLEWLENPNIRWLHFFVWRIERNQTRAYERFLASQGKRSSAFAKAISPPTACPSCGGGPIVPIVYGLQGRKIVQEQGTAILSWAAAK